MNTMRVYHLTHGNLGECVILKPNIPECAVKAFEDKTIPRICVATSIMGCLRGLELPGSDLGINFDNGESTDIFCYVADVDVNFLYQPSVAEVKDVFITGELWITIPYEFHLLRKFELKKADTSSYPIYSRYMLYDSERYNGDNYTTKFISINCGPDLLEE